MKWTGWLLAAFCCVACAQDGPWKFAVSGDSRDCGDIVMPAIASSVRHNRAEFYWHLGDFRAIYMMDEDMAYPPSIVPNARPMNVITYLTRAWPDFIEHQLDEFENVPVFLGIGNHETIPPSTREAYLTQFADWLAKPVIREQRLKDDPKDHKLRTYYHWMNRGVDFISLDNASSEQFDTAQLAWVRGVIQRDETSPDVTTIVLGMHAALPGSLGNSHSMSDSAQGDKSGRDVYEALWHAQSVAHKKVYILASHSHFLMEDVYRTDVWKGKVLPGWIIGTAGAVRYRLPAEAGPNNKAMTDVYGYLLASVAADGAISFEFKQVNQDDLFKANEGFYPEELVRWCYSENKQ
jgi:hypothetical protein